MYPVELYLKVHQHCLVDGNSERQTAKDCGISRNGVRKMLMYSKPPEASAAIYSLMEMAKSCGHNLYGYFRDIFIRLPQKISSGENPEELLPYNWKPQAP